jgi:hypothetical protein
MQHNHDRARATMPEEFCRTQAEREIREAMRCPVDWTIVFRIEDPAAFEPLEARWYAILAEHVRGDESEYVGPDYWLATLSDAPDAELQAIQHNVNLWKEGARNQFLAAVRRFTDVRYASRREYGKHLPPLGPSPGRQWIEDESRKHGISIFYFDIPEEGALLAFLHGIFWYFATYETDFGVATEAEKLWEKIMNDANSRICFRCSGFIGASRGAQTEFICFELGATTPIVHGYPIAEDEARRIHDGCAIQTITELEQWELH